jgi:hypothetical protein
MKLLNRLNILRMLTPAFALGLAVAALANDEADQADFPQIIAQPTDQGVIQGEDVTLSVQATNADGLQWLRNGVPISGATNAILTLSDIGTNDAALYSCKLSKGLEEIPTRSASVNVLVLTASSQFQVYGTPVVSAGSKGTCPGSYAGYVNYTKTVAQGWGWTPSTSPHTASDSTRSNTKIEYVGKFGDHGCAQTSVTVPDPTASPSYRFTIYFPNNVPTGSYPITLSGFNP